MALLDTAYRSPPGPAFEQQAKSNIWKSIVCWLGEQPWLLQRLKNSAAKLEAAYKKVGQQLQEPVDTRRLACELQITEEQLGQWLNEISVYFTAWPRSFLGIKEKSSDVQRIALAIAKLPLRTRLVVTLSHYEELSHEEIAQIMGEPKEVVTRICAQAGLQLKALLAEAA